MHCYFLTRALVRCAVCLLIFHTRKKKNTTVQRVIITRRITCQVRGRPILDKERVRDRFSLNIRMTEWPSSGKRAKGWWIRGRELTRATNKDKTGYVAKWKAAKWRASGPNWKHQTIQSRPQPHTTPCFRDWRAVCCLLRCASNRKEERQRKK